MLKRMRVLIVGCGYVGQALGAALVQQGHTVFGLRRSLADAAALTGAGIQPLQGDITRVEDLAQLPGPFDWVVNTVSSTRGGLMDYRRVYLDGTRNLINWLAGSGLQKFVYTSSTSVYGQTDGSVVTETSPTQPTSPTSQLLVQAEQLLLEAARHRGFPAVILRVAGIYGPGRGHLFLQYLRGEARLEDGGQRFINMIHRDDVVGVIMAVLHQGQPGEIYNAVDDQPVRQIEFFSWLSAKLGRPMPPPAVGARPPSRKRGLTNKQVSNQKLKQTCGYVFRYPTYREGYTVEIQRLQAAGQLHLPAQSA
jgi:nucleoside-diphosphate-sugar epimerase